MGTCAPTLLQYRTEWNQYFPSRDKASDGCCAGTAHSKQNPTSDHEPNKFGVCRACDIDEDVGKPAPGIVLPAVPPGKTLWWLWLAMFTEPDRRVKYQIYERGIGWPNSPLTCNPADPSTWGSSGNPRRYFGLNAHTHHHHLSIWDDPKVYNSTDNWLDKWLLNMPAPRPPSPVPPAEVAAVNSPVVEFPHHPVNVDPNSNRFMHQPFYVLDISGKRIIGYWGADLDTPGCQYDSDGTMTYSLEQEWVLGELLDMQKDPASPNNVAVYTTLGNKYSFPSKI